MDVPWALIITSFGYMSCVLIDKLALNKYHNRAYEYLAMMDATNDLPQDQKEAYTNKIEQEYLNNQQQNSTNNIYTSSDHQNKHTITLQKKTFSHQPLDQSQNLLDESFLQKRQRIQQKYDKPQINQSFAQGYRHKHDESFASSVYEFTQDNNNKQEENYMFGQTLFNRSQQTKNQGSQSHQQFGVLVVYVMYSIGEGLALGITEKVPQLIFLTIIVFMRKSSEILHFSLYLKVDNAEKDTHSIFIIIYTVMLPIGVGIGWVINGLDDKISGFFFAASSGIFLYICSSYLVIEEFQFTKYQKWTKYFLSFTGMCLTIGLVITQKGIEDREF